MSVYRTIGPLGCYMYHYYHLHQCDYQWCHCFEIGANGKNVNDIDANGVNVSNQWYHWGSPKGAQNHAYCEGRVGVIWIWLDLPTKPISVVL